MVPHTALIYIILIPNALTVTVKRGTSLYIEYITQPVVDMDNYKIPTSVLIDLSKAFDTLNHDILISKLKHYSVFGVELNFFFKLSLRQSSIC